MNIRTKRTVSFFFKKLRAHKRQNLKKPKLIGLKVLLGSKRIRLFGRLRNKHRDREAVIEKMEQLDNEEFKKQYRYDRPTFNRLLALIEPRIISNALQGRRSSGQPVQPQIKLATVLRILDGGSYLDISFGYAISRKHVYNYIWQLYYAIDATLDNIKLPLEDEEKLRDLERGLLNIIFACDHPL